MLTQSDFCTVHSSTVLTQCDSCPVRSSLVLTQCEFCPVLVLSFGGVEWIHVLVTIDEQFCATVQATGSRIRHLSRRLGTIQCLSALVAELGSSWLIHLVVHRRVTGSAGFDPRKKQWTVTLRQVPRNALLAPVRMLHDDTGNGENGQRPILHSSRPRALQKRPMVVLSSVYWMDPLSWLLRV